MNLDDIRVATPCPASWDDMLGNDRVRHCGQCRLSVYNLSAMTRQEALALVERAEGRVCGRFYRRIDGTLITRDCPVGVADRRRPFVRILAGLVTLTLIVAVGAKLAGADVAKFVERVCDRIGWTHRDPPPPVVMGEICPPGRP